MAKLVVIEYRYKPTVGLLAVLLGLLFVAFAILSSMGKLGGEPIPLGARIFMAFMGLLGLAAGLWQLVQGPKLVSTIRRLSESLSLDGDRLVLGGPLRLRRGQLRVVYEAPTGDSGSMRIHMFFEEQGEMKQAESLGPEDFAGPVSVLANISYTAIGPMRPTYIEWVRIPAYEIVDPSYKVTGASIYIAMLPPLKHIISLAKSRLGVARERDIGVAEVRVTGDGVEGILSYTKPVEGRSRALKLEIEASIKGARYKGVIARLDRPGSMEFRWRPSPPEPVYIVISDQTRIRPDKLLERLGIREPMIAGEAWNSIERAKLKLVLEIPMAKDVVDEAEITARPASP